MADSVLMPDRKIEMPYGSELAFHCQKCGGAVDEYGKCHYCGSENKIRYYSNDNWLYGLQRQLQFYIELDKEKKFYFNHVKDMEMESVPEIIEFTMLEDTTRHFAKSPSRHTLRATFYLDENSLFKAHEMETNTEYKAYLCFKTPQKEYTQKMYVDYASIDYHTISQNSLAEGSVRFIIGQVDDGKSDMTAPDSTRCPNCGAIVRKAYGCCDYCGGWVEYR